MNGTPAVSPRDPEYTSGPQTPISPIVSQIFIAIGLIFASAPLLSLIVTIPPLTPWIIAINGLALFVLGLILKQPNQTEYSPKQVEKRLKASLAQAYFETALDNPAWGQQASIPLTPSRTSQHSNTYGTTPVAASHRDGTDPHTFSSFFANSLQIGQKTGTIHSTYTVQQEGLDRTLIQGFMATFPSLFADEIKGPDQSDAAIYNALSRTFMKFQNRFKTSFPGAELSFSFVFIFNHQVWTANSGLEEVYFMKEGAIKISMDTLDEDPEITRFHLIPGYLVMVNLACKASPMQLYRTAFPPQPLVFPNQEGPLLPADTRPEQIMERLQRFAPPSAPINPQAIAQRLADRMSTLNPELPATVMIVDLSRTVETAPVEE